MAWAYLLLFVGVCLKLWKLDGRPMDWPLKIGVLLLAFQLARIVSAAMDGAVQA